MPEIYPPQDVEQLKDRVQIIAGMTLSELAATINICVPDNLQREKGWVGQLIEKVLGATAGNKPEPDFIGLGIELKTLPINKKGLPSESTYVCVVPLTNTKGLHWENSLVKTKLNHVLWIPVESDKEIPLAHRKVGMGILWQANNETEALLAADFNEFINRISLGEVESITADQGNVLQIRPKAANASVLTQGIGEDGLDIKTLPRGFYLRPVFTKKIISDWQSETQ